MFEADTNETEKAMLSVVSLLLAEAPPADVVLLAPAAAPIDPFTNYVDRKDRFTRAAHEVLGGDGDDNE